MCQKTHTYKWKLIQCFLISIFNFSVCIPLFRWLFRFCRICPGRFLAENSIFIMLATILAGFEISLAKDPASGKEIPIIPKILSGFIRCVTYICMLYQSCWIPLFLYFDVSRGKKTDSGSSFFLLLLYAYTVSQHHLSAIFGHCLRAKLGSSRPVRRRRRIECSLSFYSSSIHFWFLLYLSI
jgi:hypothetical protein